MSIEVRPVGVTCNLRCAYCYEQPIRDITPTLKYDKAAVLAQLESSQGQWSLFGGEALILPLSDIEELLQIGYERWGGTGIQTNGTLITPEHITVFEKYQTHVGISLDGPDDLNDSRWAGTLEATRKATAKTHAAIDMLLTRAHETNNPNLLPSLIITLHAGNASESSWPRMKEWLIELDRRGIRSVNFHMMELDYKATKSSEWYLPHDRTKEVVLDLWEMSTRFNNIRIVNFKEIVELLRGDGSKAMCVWHACDPWNTAAVQGLEGDGSPSHCTRTNKDGIDWLPAEGFGDPIDWQIGKYYKTNRSHERQLSLYVTPQEHGGCQGCRFWTMCTGQCPGTGEESADGLYGDWRLRSSYCQTWKDLFEEGERRLREIGETPLSLSPIRERMETIMYESWSRGEHAYLGTAKLKAEGRYNSALHAKNGHGDQHGDHLDVMQKGFRKQRHGDYTDPITNQHTNIGPPFGYSDDSCAECGEGHMDIPHGDGHADHVDASIVQIQPHGDQHGDHTDASYPPREIIPHGDHYDIEKAHGPHGDAHGDHVDASQERSSQLPHANIPHGDEHGDHVDTTILLVPHGDAHGNQHGDHTDDSTGAWRPQENVPHGDHHGDHIDSALEQHRHDTNRTAVTTTGDVRKLW